MRDECISFLLQAKLIAVEFGLAPSDQTFLALSNIPWLSNNSCDVQSLKGKEDCLFFSMQPKMRGFLH